MQLEPVELALAAEDDADILDVLPASAATSAMPVSEMPIARKPGFIRRTWRFVGSVLEWLFGAVSLCIGLAVLAALPLFQFLSLGYLLEAGARVARTGKLRHGFIGVRTAARIGSLCLGTWLFFLPVRFVADLALSAEIIDPGGSVARKWRAGLFIMIGLTFIHIASAWSRGGRLRDFAWPFNVIWLIRRLLRGGFYREARDAVWNRTVSLRLPYYFWLGVRGFLGALAWLALPITLLACGRGHAPIANLAGFAGGLMLAIVLLYLPFLQMRLAISNRFRAVFELGAARRDFKRAPWAFAFALFITLLFAVPLYLLKIEVVPREAAWLPSLVFIVFIFPARLLTGWAMARASARQTPRHWFFRWTARVPLLPIVLIYAVIVFFTQYTSWNGVWSLYEQHAFLLPVPFFGM
jgi:hypothetical protein